MCNLFIFVGKLVKLLFRIFIQSNPKFRIENSTNFRKINVVDTKFKSTGRMHSVMCMCKKFVATVSTKVAMNFLCTMQSNSSAHRDCTLWTTNSLPTRITLPIFRIDLYYEMRNDFGITKWKMILEFCIDLIFICFSEICTIFNSEFWINPNLNSETNVANFFKNHNELHMLHNQTILGTF